jgi:hypothetical protein
MDKQDMLDILMVLYKRREMLLNRNLFEIVCKRNRINLMSFLLINIKLFSEDMLRYI